MSYVKWTDDKDVVYHRPSACFISEITERIVIKFDVALYTISYWERSISGSSSPLIYMKLKFINNLKRGSA
jgi:hypothetical protein